MGQRGFIVWLTGLSGAGKSTLAKGLRDELRSRGLRVEVLDGDEVRQNLSKGLGFSKADRDANIRRIGYVANLLARNGIAVIAAAISPYAAVRREVRRSIDSRAAFVEVHVDCPIDELQRRDPKGLYKQAAEGELDNLSGISDPYEPPTTPEVHIESARQSKEESLRTVLDYLEAEHLIPGG